MSRKKITVVGAGHVGAHTAMWCAMKELGDVVLVDIVEGMPQGIRLDLLHAGAIEGFDSNIIGTNDYKDTEGSDVVIITAGLPRKPGMDRSDLVKTNAGIMESVMGECVKYSPDAHYIIVTNPLDVMVYIGWKLSGLKPEKVTGLSGALDGGRFKAFIAMELGVSVQTVEAMVIGGHADEMVPLAEYSTVSGVPISQLMDEKRLEALIARTKTAGGEIVGLLKKGSAYYAPSRAATEMAESILLDKKKIIPCASYCSGEYGVKDMFIGVPAVIGAGGVEKIIELDLSDNEKADFQNSVDAIRGLIDTYEGA